MTTFNSSRELLLSNAVGIGKTDHISAIASLTDNVLTYDNESVAVSPQWIEAYALMSVHTKLTDLPKRKQIEQLVAYSENRLCLTHKFDAVPTTKAIKTAIAGHYLTSDEMLDNYFKLISFEQVKAVFELLSSLNDKKTKEELLKVISACKHLLVTSEQLQAVQVLQDKERGLLLGKNALETLGCSEVKFISDTRLSALCSYRNYDDVLAQIKDLLVYDPTADTSRGGSVTIFFDVIEG